MPHIEEGAKKAADSVRFRLYQKSIPEPWLGKMFDLLADNMDRIAPSGCSREEDRAVWYAQVVPNFESVILMLDEEELAGYFQYAR